MHCALLIAAAAGFIQSIDSTPPRHPPRSIAVDERLAADAGLRIGDRVLVAGTPGGAADTAIITAFVARRADPSEIARSEYRVRMHLDELQRVIGYGDRVDRFAVRTRGAAATDSALTRINAEAFGFQAYRTRDISVETSRTFLVVSRFHRAIGVITVVASAVFLLCIMLLKVEERRREVAALRLLGISRQSIVRTVMIESALIAVAGSTIGVGVGWVGAAIVNWHYRGEYRTPLAFALVTPGIVVFAVALSIVLGLVAGFLAAQRLVHTPPLALLTGRRELRQAARVMPGDAVGR